MARAAVRREYDANQIVFLEGEPCAGLYSLQEGWLKSVKISQAGREQVLRFVGPGEVFNEIGVLAGATNQATVVALEHSLLWTIQREAMRQLLEDHPHVALIVTQNLAKRVLHLISLVEDLSLRSVQARLARFLLEQSDRGAVARYRWTTQAELAARLGTVPDVLSRALRSLVEDGLIRVGRHEIQLLDHEGMESKAMIDT